LMHAVVSARGATSTSFASTSSTRVLAYSSPPDEGDVFFDMEGDPLYRPERGLEYLFGVYLSHERKYVPVLGA